MKTVSILKNHQVLFTKCQIAQSFTERLVGLLNRKSLEQSESLLIKNCKQVHTCFMRFPIDAIFLNESFEVVGVSQLKPWRISPYFRKATQVLETKWGASKELKITAGQQLELGGQHG